MITGRRTRPTSSWLRLPKPVSDKGPAPEGGASYPCSPPAGRTTHSETSTSPAHDLGRTSSRLHSGRRVQAGDFALHPGTRILIYALSAVALPALDEIQLALLASAAALTLIGRHLEIWRLCRRTRWLFLMLLLTYAYSLPGEAVWPQAGALSPSQEGLAQGLLQAARLGVLLSLLDILILRVPTEALLSGIHQVLAPFTCFGLDRARATVRLALTLEVMARPPAWRGIQDIVSDNPPEGLLPDRYILILRPMGWKDWGVLTLLLLGVVWLYA